MSLKKRKKIVIFILVFLVVFIGLYAYFSGRDRVQKERKIAEIKQYPYTLYAGATKLYKDLFNELKEVLSKDKIVKEEYASLVASLFVVDFYNLDNKITSTDIGGLEFIHSDIKENFRLKASDTIYRGIESNVYDKRKQKLPIVTKINTLTVEKINYEKEKIRDLEAYQVDITWSYKEDLSYPTKAKIILVNEAKLISIVEIR